MLSFLYFVLGHYNSQLVPSRYLGEAQLVHSVWEFIQATQRESHNSHLSTIGKVPEGQESN